MIDIDNLSISPASQSAGNTGSPCPRTRGHNGRTTKFSTNWVSAISADSLRDKPQGTDQVGQDPLSVITAPGLMSIKGCFNRCLVSDVKQYI